MPLKKTKTFLNDQARDAATTMLYEDGLNEFTKVGTSYYKVVETDEGKRLVELAFVVRDFKIKTGKEAETINFEGEDAADNMLQWIQEDYQKKQAKAREKKIEKEERARKDIEKRKKLMEEAVALEAKKKDVGYVGGEIVMRMMRNYEAGSEWEISDDEMKATDANLQ